MYSNDFTDSLKKYYADMGKENEDKVPTIVRIIDSFGNDLHPDPELFTIFSLYDTPAHWLHPGDLLSVEVEIDPAFPEKMYEISWTAGDQPRGTGKRLQLSITNADVGERFYVECRVTIKRDWHRYVTCDDRVSLAYRVLPSR